MARRGIVAAAAAGVLAALSVSGSAVAADRQPQRDPGQRGVSCERLEDAAQALRARIGEIQAMQERIRAKLASGELRPAQEARAKHALRTLEALQQHLEVTLARVQAVYAEKCVR